jgi:tetratricopeptide (TPR) repeat protein
VKRSVKYFLSILFISCFTHSFAQKDPVEILNAELRNARQDTTRLRLLVALSEESELNNMLKYAEPALILADKLLVASPSPEGQYKIWLLNKKALAINNIAYVYYNIGKLPLALENWQKSLKISEETGDKQNIAVLYNNLATLYDTQGAIPKALEYHSKSLKLQKELGNKIGIAITLNNIGVIYDRQNEKAKAFEYFIKSVESYELAGAKDAAAHALNNIAAYYAAKNDSTNAMHYYRRSLAAMEGMNDRQGIAVSLNNIGDFYYKLHKDMQGTLKYYDKALKIYKEVNDQLGAAIMYNNIGTIYTIHGKHRIARAYYDSALVIARKLDIPENIKNAEWSLISIDSVEGNFKGAFAHYKEFVKYRDKIINEESRKASYRSQVNYEFEKKQGEIKAAYDKEQAIAEEQNRRQKIVIWAAVIGAILVLFFAVFVARSLSTTRKQKHIIEEKQKDILDSIRYAKRIQTSLMPSDKYISKTINRIRKK